MGAEEAVEVLGVVAAVDAEDSVIEVDLEAVVEAVVAEVVEHPEEAVASGIRSAAGTHPRIRRSRSTRFYA